MKFRRLMLVVLALVSVFFIWRPFFPYDFRRSANEAAKSSSAEKPEPREAGRSPNLASQLQAAMVDANRPIQFFGRVIDQHSQPIPGVKVTLLIRRTKALGPLAIGDTFDYPSLTTDADGRFALLNANGALLEMKSLEKPGYEPSEKALRASYWYWREPKVAFHPNPEHPEIFRMWEKAGAEWLEDKSQRGYFRYDGTPVVIDLHERPLGNGGDLRVVLVRKPETLPAGKGLFEWTLTIAAVDGGLIESNDEQMYRAPDEGYRPEVIIHVAADDPKWTDHGSFSFYLRLRGGTQYGRAEISVLGGAERQSAVFELTSYINPTGSKNLEYDSLQHTRPRPDYAR
ncbi:MAG TPA: carboxypeptidase-like regulatory domain-containing protein [Opitutaceae bacterium]|nr:carboxypeptidase-like regulatory domain-containing protein [Opitutaceae bacterium]